MLDPRVILTLTSRAGLSFQSDHATNPGDRIYVYFAVDPTVSKGNIKTCVRPHLVWSDRPSI